MTPNTQNDVLIEKCTYFASKDFKIQTRGVVFTKSFAKWLPQSGNLDNLTNSLDICDTHLSKKCKAAISKKNLQMSVKLAE